MDLVSPLREAKGVMKNSTKRSEYIGTFIKASGAVRKMRFTTAGQSEQARTDHGLGRGKPRLAQVQPQHPNEPHRRGCLT